MIVTANVVHAAGLTMRFGGVTALDRFSLSVTEGETVAVVGPNGAGKSTLLSLLAGHRAPSEGSLEVVGVDMTSHQGHRMARAGVGLAHQVPKPFTRLTVRQNLEVGAQVLPRAERTEAVNTALVHTGLADREQSLAGSLGLLDLKRLELARALSLRPQVLLLDEVAAGLNGDDLLSLIELLRDVRQFVPTVILVEHVQDVIHALAERVVVLEWGRVIAEGTPTEISRNPRVIESYLGDSRVSLAHERRDVADREPVLAATDLHVRYAGVRALSGVSLEVGEGEIVAVLGANGAGKTTLSKALLGAVDAASGTVALNGVDITSLRPHQRVGRGISICPEGRRLFPDLTVAANLELGLADRSDRSRLEAAHDLFPKLTSMRDRRAGTLSGGEQQMVAIGRALASNPKVIVMDEVSLGLAPVIIDQLYEAISTIRDWGTAIVLVEQNIHRALAVSDRVLLLQQGRPLYFGSAHDVDESRLAEIYLGPGSDAPDLSLIPPHIEGVA